MLCASAFDAFGSPSYTPGSFRSIIALPISRDNSSGPLSSDQAMLLTIIVLFAVCGGLWLQLLFADPGNVDTRDDDFLEVGEVPTILYAFRHSAFIMSVATC
jgi:hypothetical protein